MKAPQDIIIRPIMTEKSITSVADKKYTFKVAKDSNKIEIAQAVDCLLYTSASGRATPCLSLNP